MGSGEVIWRLKTKEDRRFRGGHPWVYSNELQGSPKGIEPGAPIELCDAGGNFLARGYGNPASLIAFRALSRDPAELAPHSPESLLGKLRRALELRRRLGLAEVSFRLCHGEADELPGLVIDCYRLDTGERVFVAQAHTAGADRWIAGMSEVLEPLHADLAGPKGDFAIVVRNDLTVRKLEGLQEEDPRLARAFRTERDLAHARIRVRSAVPGAAPVLFRVDLLGGQKTGFFLDQGANIAMAVDRFRGLDPSSAPSSDDRLRILDLCCYVGQWGTQLAAAFGGGPSSGPSGGRKVEVLAVDASERALEFARANVESQPGARFEALKGDVLRDLAGLPDRSFDLVISDPPGLIKSRRDHPQGKHAYLQLNTQALRLVRQGGAIVSCSCSALLDEEEFLGTLNKAASRNHRTIQWVGRGSQGPDHPMLAAFPEGRYLKCWIGWAAN